MKNQDQKKTSMLGETVAGPWINATNELLKSACLEQAALKSLLFLGSEILAALTGEEAGAIVNRFEQLKTQLAEENRKKTMWAILQAPPE